MKERRRLPSALAVAPLLPAALTCGERLKALGLGNADEPVALAHRYQQAAGWQRRRPRLEGGEAAPRGSAAFWTADLEPGRPDLHRL